ncbi:MAG: hypothetical protein AAGI45_21205 [Cyanobacteria bacterium P01_H01_bin.26]
MLNLGKGVAFIGQQYRITLNNTHFYYEKCTDNRYPIWGFHGAFLQSGLWHWLWISRGCCKWSTIWGCYVHIYKTPTRKNGV